MLNKLILLDGMALAYRAHFALIRSPRMTSGGICTSAVFGILNTLLDILKRESPTHVAVAFDTREPTARHALFPAYKAQRDAMPEDIAKQLPYIERLFEAFNVPVIKLPGYEADDIIGTLAHQAVNEGFQVLMNSKANSGKESRSLPIKRDSPKSWSPFSWMCPMPSISSPWACKLPTM